MHYCNRACRRAHWRAEHKRDCGATAQELCERAEQEVMAGRDAAVLPLLRRAAAGAAANPDDALCREILSTVQRAIPDCEKALAAPKTARGGGRRKKKTKPNAKCPCGSGKKYKKCCRDKT